MIFLQFFTNLCCFIFRYGKPLHNSSVPGQYMRSYPDWAISRKEAASELPVVDSAIVCQVLAHVSTYLDPVTTAKLAEQLGCSQDNKCLSSALLKVPTETARHLLKQLCPIVPGGKCLEALVMYKYGGLLSGNVGQSSAKMPGTSARACTSSATSSTSTSSSNITSTSSSSEPMCLDDEGGCHQYPIFDFHAYTKNTHSPSSVPGIHYGHSGHAKADAKYSRCKKNKLGFNCKKKICRTTKRKLTQKIIQLERKVHNLKDELSVKTCENSCLSVTLDTVQKELDSLKKSVNGPKLTIDDIKDSDELIQLHTGLPSYKCFKWIYTEVEPVLDNMQYWRTNNPNTTKNYQQGSVRKPGRCRVLSKQNELLLTLMKLKLNMIEDYLAYLFKVSQSTISNVLSTWIPLLSHELAPLIYWPTSEEIKQCYPDCFKKWTGIKAIIDCFEIPTEKPSHVEANTQIFSAYKNRPTTKFLLACTPGGSISFLSPPAGGNMSDKELVLTCDLPAKFSLGDKCMADKGFRVKGELLEHGVELVIPPFVKKGQPFTEKENKSNKEITHARIHVERVIGRLRDYKYLSGVIPITQLDLIGPAATVCCALTNLKGSVVT